MQLLALPFRTLRYGSFQRSFRWGHLLAVRSENFGHAYAVPAQRKKRRLGESDSEKPPGLCDGFPAVRGGPTTKPRRQKTKGDARDDIL